jgi:hypothetical protein
LAKILSFINQRLFLIVFTLSSRIEILALTFCTHPET